MHVSHRVLLTAGRGLVAIRLSSARKFSYYYVVCGRRNMITFVILYSAHRKKKLK